MCVLNVDYTAAQGGTAAGQFGAVEANFRPSKWSPIAGGPPVAGSVAGGSITAGSVCGGCLFAVRGYAPPSRSA